MDILVTAVVTLITAIVVAMVLFLSVILPLQSRRDQLIRERDQLIRDLREVTIEIQEERYLRADLVKWIEIECFKFKGVEKALKQRIDERLEVMRQLRIQRRQLIR